MQPLEVGKFTIGENHQNGSTYAKMLKFKENENQELYNVKNTGIYNNCTWQVHGLAAFVNVIGDTRQRNCTIGTNASTFVCLSLRMSTFSWSRV